jgi:hypothetical protein
MRIVVGRVVLLSRDVLAESGHFMDNGILML